MVIRLIKIKISVYAILEKIVCVDAEIKNEKVTKITYKVKVQKYKNTNRWKILIIYI